MTVRESLLTVFNLRMFFIVLVALVTIEFTLNYTSFSSRFSRNILFLKAVKKRKDIYQFAFLERSLPECPVIPPKLQGRLTVNTTLQDWALIEKENPDVTSGGRYKPPNCTARHRVAIVIPYRDREKHLKLFLRHMHPFLKRQQLDYGLYVVEMNHETQFNRAKLMNIGFNEAMEQYDYQCFIFHDVDLLPEDGRILYTCPEMPRHMSSAIDRHGYKCPYPHYFGGVSAISTNQIRLINGFSNIFFGWGGEDDEIYQRLYNRNLFLMRYSEKFARYKMLKHGTYSSNPQRFEMLRSTKGRQDSDGLSSLKYSLIKLEKKPLFTWIYVSLNTSKASNEGPVRIKTGAQFQKEHFLEVKKKDNQKRNDASSMKPLIVNWIPRDYKGEIDANLTKF